MKIFIDPRSGSKDLVHAPCLRPYAQLLDIHPCGDVLILGNGPCNQTRKIGAEIKSLTDFVQSIITNRLTATQLPPMFESCDVVYVLVYGQLKKRRNEWVVSTDNGTTWNKAYGGKVSTPEVLQTIFCELEMAGVHVHLHPNLDTLCERILSIATLWSKPWESHTLFQGFDISRLPGRNDRSGLLPVWRTDKEYNIALVASTLPNVGFTTAKLASRYFSSVYDMITASRDRWEQLENVGKVTSKKILKFVLEGESK